MEKKRIRSLMIIFLVFIIPGYIRLFYSNAFDSVRAVVIMQLLVTGILTGILIMIAKNYFRRKKIE
ncbi:MAG: hypothetical protein P4L27_15015 [Ignavibacteriaceae bacterium]|nr:hypothetical protein [Ignavibacteriaceae bacterium]